jgi:CRP/FNR family transcriptional regulator
MSETLEQVLERVAPAWTPDLRAAVAARGHRLRCPDGHQLFGPGDQCENFLIPLAGAVRVEHMGASGRSVVLYRIEPGGSCVMTTSCLLSGTPYQAYGYAEGGVEAIGLSAAAFRALIDEQSEFRELALGVFSQRIIELVEVIDELLLHRVDLRLGAWLTEHSGRDGVVKATHQVIASEIGTVREVVSRILKEFERRGWIALTRGEVRLVDPHSLRRFANSR